jgi:hypothetical protein
MRCPICQGEAAHHREVDGVAYFKCLTCGSLFVHPDFMAAVDSGDVGNYRVAYWEHELPAARERSFGAGVIRMAETLRMARTPVRRALDIGSGPGFLLDALAELVPSLAERTHGVELFPPPPHQRTQSPNFHVGSVGDLEGSFDAGVCIEVIEHLTPTVVTKLLGQLAAKSSPGALYFFNSSQPSFIETTDPGYLDPHNRGHVVSWSLAGARVLFEPAGFNVIALPGRDWAFLAEFGPPRRVEADMLAEWLGRPVPENIELIRKDRFGSLFETIGLESARCYFESAAAEARTRHADEHRNERRQARWSRLNPFASDRRQ